MHNAEIIRQIELYASLRELQGENEFKLRAYRNAVFHLEKLDVALDTLPLADIERLEGVGKAIALKIDDARQNGTFRQLRELLAQIPAGIVELLDIPGLGAKKLRVLWQELGIEDADQLLQACENNQIAAVKGFGTKTQENIKNALSFKAGNSGKVLYHIAEEHAKVLHEYLRGGFPELECTFTGELRRRAEVVARVQVVCKTESPQAILAHLDKADFLQKDSTQPSLYTWQGKFGTTGLAVEVRLALPPWYGSEIFLHSAAATHLSYRGAAQTHTLGEIAARHDFAHEQDVYATQGLPYCPPEMREGTHEWEWLAQHTAEALLKVSDIKGIIHAHSTYSDGKHSLAAMVQACQAAGYQYLGITDHSQAAFYANGLDPQRVKAQHQEIDALNAQFAPFRIFKGIEADILPDGNLDYTPELLAQFDFVIASVHSGLRMSEAKATERLIRAIANPHTTILGHLTGRLLLRREGYPINHQAVIDACAAYGVIIEINASPWRLDIDWRWIHYALNQGVMLSINPDAHEIATIHEVKYGVGVGRKGGLTPTQTFNTRTTAEVAAYFADRKQNKGIA